MISNSEIHVTSTFIIVTFLDMKDVILKIPLFLCTPLIWFTMQMNLLLLVMPGCSTTNGNL